MTTGIRTRASFGRPIRSGDALHVALMALVSGGVLERRDEPETTQFRWSRQAEDATQFTCPVCGAASAHPEDQRHGYCGRCHAFTGHGTSGGVVLTDEVIERAARDAEQGYDVNRLRPRTHRGEPLDAKETRHGDV